MQDTRTRSSYTFYGDDKVMEKIDDIEDYARSEAVREALSDWLSKRNED